MLRMLKLFLIFYSIDRHKAPPWLLIEIADLVDNEIKLLGVEHVSEILFDFISLLLISKHVEGLTDA